MSLRSVTWWSALLGLLPLMGCFYPVREKIDAGVCDIAKQPFDVQQLEAADQQPLMPSAEDSLTRNDDEGDEDDDLLLASAQPADKDTDPPAQSLRSVRELEEVSAGAVTRSAGPVAGGALRELNLGPATPENAARRRELLRREFQPLRPPGADYRGVPGPNGHPLTLAELQRIGMSSSPLITQAVAAVEVARGNAFQAGLMPNPIMGFEVDTFGTTGGAATPAATWIRSSEPPANCGCRGPWPPWTCATPRSPCAALRWTWRRAFVVGTSSC